MLQSHQYRGRLQNESYTRSRSRLAPLNVLDREAPTGHWTTAHVFSTASRTFALSRLEMSKASLSASCRISPTRLPCLKRRLPIEAAPLMLCSNRSFSEDS